MRPASFPMPSFSIPRGPSTLLPENTQNCRPAAGREHGHQLAPRAPGRHWAPRNAGGTGPRVAGAELTGEEEDPLGEHVLESGVDDSREARPGVRDGEGALDARLPEGRAGPVFPGGEGQPSW